ncbi:aminoacyl-tRNA hydrolase [Burkholderiaceae bacterium FT117]|uniref:aminoacyl-tRNA hydrolase n=1 Tax=Zeimonas sediminis TaxID=2944268 RepID=UPI002342EB66|nr:aminoacyl-tRNA hydrolase [Zeimonas sediminis]MCM5571781.1 aminoacyl-tRNA hydrolase [Zeimonas sediminis]
MNGIGLIVGLGNPGPEHEHDRHNAGFWFVDAVARAHGGSFAKEAKFFGEVARVRIGHAQVWLLKPTTYMNRSGLAVAALAGFYRVAPDQVLVAHDELDLLPGQAKLKKGGGSAGHNGLKDITARLGGPGFWRLRLGIGHPRTLQLNQQVADFVLHRPSREDLQAIEGEIDRGLACLPDAVAGHFEAATMKLHTRG